MLGPYIGLAMDETKINDIQILMHIHNALGVKLSPLSFIGISMIFIFSLRLFFAILINKKILSFCRNVQVSLRSNLMSAYQTMTYETFIDRDSADAITNITILPMYFTNNVLFIILKATAELLLALFVLSFLLFVNGLLVLILSVGLGVLVFLYNNFFKARLNLYGKNINIANSNVVQSVKQALDGVKEVRVLGKESFFHNRLSSNAQLYASLHASSVLISIGSRYFLEFALMIFFVGVILFSDILMSSDTSVVFATIGMFAFASIRLLPGVNILSSAVLQLRTQKNTVDRLHETIKQLDLEINFDNLSLIRENTEEEKDISFESIKLGNISYAYPNAPRSILANINIEIHKGEAVGIVGSSGSGKTTLIDIFLGLLTPKSGTIYVNGVLLSEIIQDWRKMSAYIPQESLMINESLSSNIQLAELDGSNVQNDLLATSIQQAKLGEVVKNLPDGLQTSLGENGIRLSGGQRQRVSLARAIFHSREVLIFDEATSALDTETETKVMTEIKKMKGAKTIIIVAHRTDTLRFCDRIYKLENGSIGAVGTPDEVFGHK